MHSRALAECACLPARGRWACTNAVERADNCLRDGRCSGVFALLCIFFGDPILHPFRCWRAGGGNNAGPYSSLHTSTHGFERAGDEQRTAQAL